MVAFSAAATAHNAGEPEMSGVTDSAKRPNAKMMLRSGSEQQVPPLGTTREVPEGKDEPEAAGDVLAAETLAGSEEDKAGSSV